MSYQVILEEQGFYIRHNGAANDEESIRLAKACRQDNRFDDVAYVISDYLGCESVSFSSSLAEDLAVISYNPVVSNRRLKIALVADIPDIIALATAFISSSRFNGHEMRVF